MFEIKYSDGKWWIYKNGERLDGIDGFIDPISPKIIIEEINDEL